MSEFIGSLGLFFVSLLIGLFTGILLLFVDLRSEFLAVPGFWPNPYYVIFFFTGALAQRND